ncbi:hypothetical protein ACFWHT_10740 [Microbacterium sp. NPDC058342]|uniref:hypothetical protein n=1 Tax=Microbacterium sp. NPDC058342 TaxID=3346454 RepID=UPI0036636BD4
MTRQRARSVGEILTSRPRAQLVDALLENLSRGLATPEHRTPRVWLVRRFDDGYEQRIAIWPRARRRPLHETERQAVFEVPDFGIVRIFAVEPRTREQRRLVEETVTWLGAIMRTVPPRRRLEKARHDTLTAQAEVEAAQIRIARVRDSEHIRLVESMTTAAVRDLDTVRTMLAQPARDVPWSSVSTAMTALIHDFRTVVRGVFPAMLPRRGAAEALSEIAATLPIGVEFHGDLGRRARWEIESCFALAVAGVLGALATTRKPVEVVFERDGALCARVRSAWTDAGGTLARALTSDRQRLEALGGALTIGAGPAGTEVSVTVPDRSGISWLPLSRRQLSSRPVHSRVAALLESARLPEDEIAPWRRELFAPVRLLVVQQPMPALLAGVQAVMCEEHPDGALARRLRDPDGPWGRIDAVVCTGEYRDDFVRELPEGTLLFSRGTDPADAVSMLTARAPVFAARRALAGISDYVRRHPEAEWLRSQVEHLTAGSHELVEDALLDQLARGVAPSVVDDEAARLIGAHGGDSRSRLGLPHGATPAAVADAIDVALERWTSIVAHPELDAASRSASEVVLGSATRLLMA